jgi:hypothetical protein
MSFDICFLGDTTTTSTRTINVPILVRMQETKNFEGGGHSGCDFKKISHGNTCVASFVASTALSTTTISESNPRSTLLWLAVVSEGFCCGFCCCGDEKKISDVKVGPSKVCRFDDVGDCDDDCNSRIDR